MDFSVNLCRLCLEKKNDENLIDIANVKNQQNIKFAFILKKHFWFLIIDRLANDIVGQICETCWLKTIDFHSFYTTIEKAQNNFALKTKTSSTVVTKEQYIKLEFIEGSICPVDDIKLNLNFTQPKNVEIIKDDRVSNEDLNCEFNEKSIKLENKLNDEKEHTSKSNKNSLKNHRNILVKQRKNHSDAQIREYFQMNCDLCGIAFHTFADAQLHYRAEHEQIGYLICCGQKFNRRRSMIEHVRHHINPFDRFKCEYCHRTYGKKSGLKYHILSIHGPKDLQKFECKQCLNRFFTKAKLDNHILLRHSTEADKKYSCGKCDKRFLTKSLLNVHVRNSHDMLYTQICDICAKVFKDKNGLSQHKVNVHSEIEMPRFKCEICNRWLKNKKGLKTHMSHHNDIPRECNICQKSYPNSHTLDSHIRNVHTGRNYPCKLCSKAFKKAIHLKEHISTHTGEDIYKCIYCSQTFKSSGNMYQHRKKQHKVEILRDQSKSAKLEINLQAQQ